MNGEGHASPVLPPHHSSDHSPSGRMRRCFPPVPTACPPRPAPSLARELIPALVTGAQARGKDRPVHPRRTRELIPALLMGPGVGLCRGGVPFQRFHIHCPPRPVRRDTSPFGDPAEVRSHPRRSPFGGRPSLPSPVSVLSLHPAAFTVRFTVTRNTGP